MANTSIPQTQNREWGFFGTISHHADPERAWDIALAFIAGITGCSPDATRAFLDSRHGRHPRGRHREDHRGMDGLAHHAAHEPRDRHPRRPALPDGLRDQRRDRR